MISFDDALALVHAAAQPLAAESVALEESAGRILAARVIACIDGPRADVSTMDGYAVRDSDLASLPARLPVAGESFPGSPLPGPLAPGTCLRIFTGAPLPPGADRIVIQEMVERDGDAALFAEPPGAARYIRRRASDFAAGDTLVAAGRRLDARALVAAAGGDVDRVDTIRPPRVLIVGTGDELVAPGSAAPIENAVPESLSLGLASLARACGAEIAGRRMLPDDLPLMQTAMAECLDAADVVVITGGASVGERDFARAMVGGLELIFSKVAIKPGKPVWLGRAAGRLVLGLPGNPTSALVTARLLLQPLLIGLAGGDPAAALRWRRARLAGPMDAGSDRETFWRATAMDGAAALIPNQDSGAQRSLADADLLVRQPAHAPALPAGAEVEMVDF